jgi:hypothetical protein
MGRSVNYMNSAAGLRLAHSRMCSAMAGSRGVTFVVGSIVTTVGSFMALGPPPATVTQTWPDGATLTISTNWDWPMTPAWVATFVSAAGWAMVAGLLAVRIGKLSEARRWRNRTLGLSLASLVIGLCGGLSLLYFKVKDLEQLGERVSGLDVVLVLKRGAFLAWWGVAGCGLAACFSWFLSAMRGRAIRARASRRSEGQVEP